MQFNQGQLRNWKRVLPPFSGRKKFTLGDLVVAGVPRRLTDRCGVRAGHVPEISKAIIEVCNTDAWASLQGKTLVIDVQKETCALVKSVRAFPFQDVAMVCPLESVMAQIQEELSRVKPAVIQHHLNFPPIAISGARGQGRRA
jgi:hypothetical protein